MLDVDGGGGGVDWKDSCFYHQKTSFQMEGDNFQFRSEPYLFLSGNVFKAFGVGLP